MLNFEKRVVALAAALTLNQEETLKKIGISKGAFNYLQKGDRPPSPRMLQRLEHAEAMVPVWREERGSQFVDQLKRAGRVREHAASYGGSAAEATRKAPCVTVDRYGRELHAVRNRWRRSGEEERRTMELAIRTLFHKDVDQIIAWLNEPKAKGEGHE